MEHKIKNLEFMKKVLSLLFCILLLVLVYGLISALWIGIEGIRIATSSLILMMLILVFASAVDKLLKEYSDKQIELKKELSKYSDEIGAEGTR